jgi:hypothetical protein
MKRERLRGTGRMSDNTSLTLPSGSTAAAILIGLALLVILALVAPTWAVTGYLEIMVILFIVFICLTDRTLAAGESGRRDAAGGGVDNNNEGEALRDCLENVLACL